MISNNNNNKSDSPKNKQPNNTMRTLSSAASFLGCLAIAYIVMYLINGTAGILIQTALVFACALSLIVMFMELIIHNINIEFKLDKLSVSKGETLKCIVGFQKKIPFLAPIIEIHISCTSHLAKDYDICKAALFSAKTETLEIPLTAKYSGGAQVKIDDVFMCDYLGIFRIRLKRFKENSVMELSVYPNIPDVPIQTDFLKTAVLFSNTDDEEEETNDTALTQTGQPGYDHREYYPGDPIKRINWKISSKRDIYMIRLDERIAESGQVFFLDSPQIPEDEYALSVRDNVIEGMLAVFSMMVREGKEVIFFYAKKGSWLRMDIRNMADIIALQDELSGFKACAAKDVVSPEMLGLGKTPICFTIANFDHAQSASQISSLMPQVLMICSEHSGLPRLTSDMWIISDNFELKKQL